MYIQKYLDYQLSPAVAKFYNNSIKGKEFSEYTVDIGSTGKDLWKYFMKLGRTITNDLTPDVKEVVLDKNNYYIRPIRNKDGEAIKDKLGNIKYKIEEDPTDAFKNDIILFMEIPNKNYTDVEYKVTGSATVIAKAFVGKDRADITTKSPALVLEIIGNFALTYTAKDQDGNKVSGKHEFDYKNRRFTVKEETEDKGE